MSRHLTNKDKWDIYDRRVLRLALGTALSLCFSQAVDWPLSYIAPIFTALILSQPSPAPTVKGSLVFIAILVGSLLSSFDLLPYVYYAPMAGILLIALGLFYSFYLSASGGPVLLSTFLVLSLTLITTIGSVSIDMLYETTKGLAAGSLLGFVFVWIAHFLLPDNKTIISLSLASSQSKLSKPDKTEAARKAFKSLLIVYPVMILFLCIDTSISYTVIMIKIASMGQQASSGKSKEMADSLLVSTILGGIGAVVAWVILSCCPILPLYTLLVGLACLIYGGRIFQGTGHHPHAATWIYALVTFIIILAPSVGSMASGDSSSDKFWLRILYFLIIAIYGWFMVTAYEAFFTKKNCSKNYSSTVTNNV